jgi:hypothetical protein
VLGPLLMELEAGFQVADMVVRVNNMVADIEDRNPSMKGTCALRLPC